MTFQWKELECYEENGPITGYNYRIYQDMSRYISGNVGANTTRLSLFKANIQYFRVAAINKAGIGPHCPQIPVPRFDQGDVNFQYKLCAHYATCLFLILSKNYRERSIG